MTRAAALTRLGLAAGPMLALLTSCAEAAPIAVAPGRVLPVYQGPAVALFDDGIEPQPANAGFEPGASQADNRLLRERTELGDCVVRARIVTVTSTQGEAGASWLIGLHALETLAGELPAGTDWTVRVSDGGAAAGVLRSLEGRLIDRPFIAFLREFSPAGGGGGRELHFHLAGEDGDQLGAVRTAALLAQVK
jgi:hypothetical protein